MIYVENDFYSNFQALVNSNDENALEQIFIDQISHIVAKQRGEVLSLLKKVKIATSENPSNEEICNLIVQNIKTNVKLRAGISYIIAKNNDLLAVEKKNNRKKSEDKSEKKTEKLNWEESADTVTFIATSLSDVANALKGNRLNNFLKDLKKQTNAKAPNYSSQSYSNADAETKPPAKKSNKWKWIVAGVIIAGGIYYAYKKGYIGKKADAPSIEPPIIE